MFNPICRYIGLVVTLSGADLNCSLVTVTILSVCQQSDLTGINTLNYSPFSFLIFTEIHWILSKHRFSQRNRIGSWKYFPTESEGTCRSGLGNGQSTTDWLAGVYKGLFGGTSVCLCICVCICRMRGGWIVKVGSEFHFPHPPSHNSSHVTLKSNNNKNPTLCWLATILLAEIVVCCWFLSDLKYRDTYEYIQ